jgi:hypothetical protein
MKLTVFTLYQALAKTDREGFDTRGQGSEQSCTCSQPANWALEHGDAKVFRHQVAGGERGEGAVGRKVGSEQHGGGPDASFVEQRPHQSRRQVDDAGRLADERQRRRDPLDPLRIGRQGQMTDLPP